jgi:hypothetical protein
MASSREAYSANTTVAGPGASELSVSGPIRRILMHCHTDTCILEKPSTIFTPREVQFVGGCSRSVAAAISLGL